jgi:hypothetical protein
MKTEILEALSPLPYFTIAAVRQLWSDTPAAGTVGTALYRWMKAGQVLQLKRGVYMTRRFYEAHHAEPDFTPAVSALLLPHSYVSLEFVLQRHAILTEVTYPVTAVTTKNTRHIENALGTFSYRHIQPALYSGFSLSTYRGIPFARASLAKALFDYLYLRPWEGARQAGWIHLAEELRLNLEDVTDADWQEFAAYVGTSRSPKMAQIFHHLRSAA